MFTGLVEEVGRVASRRTNRSNVRFDIDAALSSEVAVGDSVAVNGCCLTAVATAKTRFAVEAVATTLRGTSLERLRSGTRVNLERAMAVGDRLGGHIVQGHVDEAGVIRRVEQRAGQWVVTVRVKPDGRRFLVEHGSVCVDGVSLTIGSVRDCDFTVNIIPHTWAQTRFPRARAGEAVNIEYDLVVKAVQRYLVLQGRGLSR